MQTAKNVALNPKVDENLLVAKDVNGLRGVVWQIISYKQSNNLADLRCYTTVAEKNQLRLE